MAGGRRPQGLKLQNLGGFTIVEVMIVLAVSSAIFLAAALLIGGKQNNTEFSQAIQQVQSQIQQAINDVASGYYPPGDFSCQGSTTYNLPPTVSPGNNGQGTNGDVSGGCIFIGKALQFATGSASSPTVNIYPIVDSGNINSANPVSSLTQAPGAVLAYTSSPTIPISLTTYSLEYGLSVYSMCSGGPCTTSGTTSIGSVVFGSYLTNGAIGNGNNGSQQVGVYPVSPSSLGASQDSGISQINSYLSTIGQDSFWGRSTNRTGEVDICFNSGGTKQSGLIAIGANGEQNTVQLKIYSGLNCS